ncbi:protein WEAK CHLOROPLAST MOVEMENT UNDER BLUE LIGHT 1-like isoform X1 [Canna indica]|uniref:Protein WEAK CHLOROPLAST MOVEMENT UNDER BLUE LIGHT 1-like isoform X1 n=1 Tax=Canna indica TaxID=4628 RepID=A0AAQ3JLK3_9LILI|nr:protein WEAK CHLOROPLAST MOVEMENT UNDER BLUE LIGHT 1-like isoform X1 [Canna indica]
MEELKLGLEKAGTQEAHAKQDSELADLRLEEMKQGIAHSVSVAAKTQLEVAKERHTSAVAELKLVRQELQSMKREFESLIHERDLAVRTAEDSVSASKEIEKTVEDLTLELITVKELLESAHSAHLEAEEQGRVAVFAFGQDRINWEKELKQAEGELQQLNEQLLLKTKGNSEIDNKQGLLANQAGDITETGTTTEAALATTTRELEEVRSNIETANDEINCLRVAVSSLKSELEKEKTALTTMRQRENLACVSISSLEAELNRVNTEVELVLKREKDTRERMVDLPKALQHAAEEADQAKLVANLAREELRKAKEEAEQAKAGARTMETRLKAALKEIEAARASEKLASSAVKALEESEQASMESEDSPNGVTLPIEEYYRLSKKANEAEEIANKRVISAVEQIKVAKESESRSLVKLEEANKMIEVKKKARAALEKAEKAKEAKICAEQELRTWREEHEQQIKVESLVRSLSDTSNLDSVGGLESTSSEADATIRSSTGPPKVNMPRSHTANELPGNKRSFFPRIAMFLARKKVQIQSLK